MCMYEYPYYIKTGLNIGTVSIHAYVYPSFKWMMDPSPGLGYGRAQLKMGISNRTHYSYTTQVQTNGNVAY